MYWDHNTNEEILQRSRRLHDIVAERRFRMVGHILRLPEERPAKMDTVRREERKRTTKADVEENIL